MPSPVCKYSEKFNFIYNVITIMFHKEVFLAHFYFLIHCTLYGSVKRSILRQHHIATRTLYDDMFQQIKP